MRQERLPNQVRDIKVTTNVNIHAEGSALVEWGHTHVLATVTLDSKLPPHLRGQGPNKSKQQGGWLTAEYAMLPRATNERVQRERLYSGGRTQEIQRLIGRAMRSVVDLSFFSNQTLIVDIDVIQADGGTRCAGIVAGYAALHDLANKLLFKGKINDWPLSHEVAAVSLGLVEGKELIDLEFSEDSKAEVDLNVVATGDGQIIEVQGGGESTPIQAEQYVQLIASGVKAVQYIVGVVKPQLH
ncbi:MAG: ribonuclease PH [Trueperaceae bacterium]